MTENHPHWIPGDNRVLRQYFCNYCLSYGLQWFTIFLHPDRIIADWFSKSETINVTCKFCLDSKNIPWYGQDTFDVALFRWCNPNISLEQAIINYCNNFKIKI